MHESYLTRKLRLAADLTAADVARLERLLAREQMVEANRDLIREGDDPSHVHVIKSGFACRYKTMPDGRRAIIALLLPGDFCDLHIAILGHMDHSIGALVDCTIARVPNAEIEAMTAEYPRINRACWWATLVDEAVLREWLVNIGRRPSNKQLGHLFCEIYMRMKAVGLTRDHEFWMPFTQATLADMLGVHSVHVQRVMSELRERNLISLRNRRLRFPDYPALVEFAEFDPTYLHLRDV